MRGTGRYNLAQGAIATVQGIGASLSGLAAGVIVDHFGYSAAFLAAGAAARGPGRVRPRDAGNCRPGDGIAAALNSVASPAGRAVRHERRLLAALRTDPGQAHSQSSLACREADEDG